MRKIDITKQDIRCCDDFYIDPSGYINIPYEMWFDVDDYFGTNVEDTDNYLNFYTYWFPGGRIEAKYEIDYIDGGVESFHWELTDAEKDFFRNMMEEYCIKNYRCTLAELSDMEILV